MEAEMTPPKPDLFCMVSAVWLLTDLVREGLPLGRWDIRKTGGSVVDSYPS